MPARRTSHGWTRTWTAILADSDRYFTPDRTTEDELTPGHGDEPAWLRFPTSRPTPHLENNIVHARYFPGCASDGRGDGAPSS